MEHMCELEELEYQEWLRQEFMYAAMQLEFDIWDYRIKEQDSAIDELPF